MAQMVPGEGGVERKEEEGDISRDSFSCFKGTAFWKPGYHNLQKILRDLLLSFGKESLKKPGF